MHLHLICPTLWVFGIMVFAGIGITVNYWPNIWFQWRHLPIIRWSARLALFCILVGGVGMGLFS